MKNILIIGSDPISFRIANVIRGCGLSKELTFLPGSDLTLKIGQNVKIPHFGENSSISDYYEIGRMCLSQIIGLVLISPEYFSDLGISAYFGKDERFKKIKVIGPIKPAAYFEDKVNWYIDKYIEEVKK